MDIEKRAKRQSRRVIISEILMVIAVIATVSILAFVVSGYWVGSDFQIERQGLLQVYSAPTGANVEIDGNPSSWLQRTNTSKTLAAGEHTIVLTKDGYDSWFRTVTITEGLLYRLHYPRLFLNERFQESAFDFSGDFASVSPDRNTMLLSSPVKSTDSATPADETIWQTFNLDSESNKLTTLSVPAGLLSGKVESADWATDNEHVLLEIKQNDAVNWVIFNIKNPSSPVNLTKEFNANFSNIKILDSSASNLLVVMDGNLHRIDVPARQISAILVPDVKSFDYYHQDVVFTAKTPSDISKILDKTLKAEKSSENSEKAPEKSAPYYLGVLKLGSNEIEKYQDLENPAEIIITKFYDDEYIGIFAGASFAVLKKNDLEKTTDFSLSFTPEKIRITNSGDAIIMTSGEKIASLDMEVMQVTEWSPETTSFGWLDGSMIYAVKDGNLTVYDFNSLNPRTLASNVSPNLPVTITSDKYLYYFKSGSLVREYLFEK